MKNTHLSLNELDLIDGGNPEINVCLN